VGAGHPLRSWKLGLPAGRKELGPTAVLDKSWEVWYNIGILGERSWVSYD